MDATIEELHDHCRSWNLRVTPMTKPKLKADRYYELKERMPFQMSNEGDVL